ncbi:methyl-accepting chemotaxis protein [Aquabacterium soli]|uniref:Methyl-accepting chemotaxis protein n=1 Tax=Aquabacterium soli TaxID=2493092 RepID=A0A3R8T471_9BURK|nr:methyl-accepting chemotaxis protein [Aquabacterium soli]RRS03635.1 methyl-accepting chemotaxis protein [Aquabacterium soli]
MKHLSVKVQLAIAFGVLTLLVLVVSIFGAYSLGDANDGFTTYVNGESRRTNLASDIRTAATLRAVAVRDMVLVDTAPEHAAQKKQAVDSHQQLQSSLRSLKEAVTSDPDVTPRDRSLVEAIDHVEARYAPVALDIVRLSDEGQRAEAIQKINVDCRPLLNQLIAAAKDYADYSRQQARLKSEAAAAALSTQRRVMLALSALATATAFVLGWLIIRRLVAALGAEPADLSQLARQVAQGDISEVRGASTAPAGSVLSSMGSMQRQLLALISQVRHTAESIASASSEIAQGNNDLSSRTEQQASALEETAASMEQLGSTVKENAAHAKQASELASDASAVAVQGGAAAEQVVSTMRGINDSSRKISDIIAVIDGIAFQTNILALNAAVEAARAGEQGRGFAVVAGEVRTLASRSSQAAREIKALIQDSVARVTQGSLLVDQAGATMQQVVTVVKRVSDIVAEISNASTEQSVGVAQVCEAVTQMDAATQQNAALVEESAAAAESLKIQAQQLVRAVAVFKLDGGHAAPLALSRGFP